MSRPGLVLLLCAGAFGAGWAGSVRMDPSGGFFVPSYLAGDGAVNLVELDGVSVDVQTYLRYLGARYGGRELDDCVFDLLLAQECKQAGVLGSAPVLARSMATQRFSASGRKGDGEAGSELRARFMTEAMRELRVNRLVAVDRIVDPVALRALFDHRYGVGGQRVRVRHVLVAFAREESEASARDKALRMSASLREGEVAFDALLKQSGDRATRRALRDPERKKEAGIVAGYNYRRFGPGFAAKVRELEVGAVSEPVESEVGYHLIRVDERVVTEFDDVVDSLRQELGGGQAKASEVTALRRRLFEKYGYDGR